MVCFKKTGYDVFLPFTFTRLIGRENFGRRSVLSKATQILGLAACTSEGLLGWLRRALLSVFSLARGLCCLGVPRTPALALALPAWTESP